MLLPTVQIVPFGRGIMIEPESPLRSPSLPLQPGPFPLAQLRRAAIVDRRLAPAELDLALEVEFLRGLIDGIDAAGGAQLLERRVVTVEARALAVLLVMIEPEPREIAA